MKSIEITTPQNVQIDYQLAGLGQRIFAYAIDFVIIVLVYAAVYIWFFVQNTSDNDLKYLLFQLFAFLWLGFYSLFSELIGNGQSIGKLAMGIRVIKLNGEEMQFYDYFSRWSMRIIDIYFSIGSIAMLLIASSRNAQRIGDIIAGTTIIRKNNSYGFKLNDILKLNLKDKDNYEFEYPLAVNLEENDVILIKQLLSRYRTFRNAAHKQAMDELILKLVDVLQLKQIPGDKETFLTKVITEYIILTR
ncbi:MAG: RDD family protein [Chitinophagaceae bacterium]